MKINFDTMLTIKRFKIIFFGLTVSAFAAGQTTVYTINPVKTYQTIDNFGASDCWTTQFYGHFPAEKREQMADWLFSLETGSNGQPKGIGLSLWRFNIGAGSAAQGSNSYIPDVTRRAECFQSPDGSYDWSRHSGQRWFLQAAKKRGVEQFLAFSISAPVQFTSNGLANNCFRPKDGTFNIKPDRYADFADFLATVLAGLKQRDNIDFQYISPFNEPEWNWDDNTSQEGTPALMQEIAKTVRLLDAKLTEKQLDTKILLTESGDINYMFRKNTNLKGRDNQIEEFFNPKSGNFVGDLRHVPAMMAGHSYWTTSPVDTMFAKRQLLRKKLDEYGLKFWQSELCIMGNDEEIGGGRGKDLTMKTALYVARIIHHDLCVANASAWHWWLGMNGGTYKDGLISVTPNAGCTDGIIEDTRLMWVLGNFSRFVRPGAVRIEVSSAENINNPKGLMISAFYHKNDKKIVVVAINYAGKKQPMKLNLKNTDIKGFTPYITSDKSGDTLKPYGKIKCNDTFEVPARSVVTFVSY